MHYLTATRRMGFVIAAIVFLFTLTTVGQADARTTSLNKMLGSSGIAFKVVRLDRTDGFLFGFTFKGKKIPTITIAPGFGRMLLVQVNGNEMIFQGDGTGKMQIIQADGDIGIALCVLDAVIEFLSGLQTCQSDPACLFTQIYTMVTTIISCSEVPTEPTL
jgi:hypothetical protein